MDWNIIETFLKNSVWGMIILGALGNGLFILIKSLLKWGKKGYQSTTQENKKYRKNKAILLLVSENYRNRYIVSMIRSFYLFTIFTALITIIFELPIESAFGFFTGFNMDVILELSILKRVYNKLTEREIKEKDINILTFRVLSKKSTKICSNHQKKNALGVISHKIIS